MTVAMQPASGEADIERVLRLLEQQGLSGRPSQGKECTVIGIPGTGSTCHAR